VIDLTCAEALPDPGSAVATDRSAVFSGVGCAHIGRNPDVVADRKRLCLDQAIGSEVGGTRVRWLAVAALRRCHRCCRGTP
jgi:hypothetical protein